MKTQRAQHSCTAFSSTWTSLKLGRVGKANIQTYVLRRCMLEGTRMRTYDYVPLHEKDEDIQHSQHDDQRLGKIQRSTFGIGVDLWKGKSKFCER